MLNAISSTINCSCDCFKTKCAEIHYQKSNFAILCVFCGMKTIDFSDFLQHFRKIHFKDFVNTLQPTSEPVVIPHSESKKAHDPLELGLRDVASNVDGIITKLEEEDVAARKVKVESSEDQEVFSDCGSNSCGSFLTRPSLIYDKSDNNNTICEIKVEQSDLEASKPRASKFIQPVQCTSNIFGNQEEGNCIHISSIDADLTIIQHEICTKSSNFTRENVENDYVNETKLEGQEDIDWSKPFEPNLLKNHEKRPYKPRNKPNVCSYCGRNFKRRYQLETHLNVHTGEKPHQCEVCGRLFRAITTLTRHLNTHEKRQTFDCKFCNKVFTHKVALISHELRHTQERKVACDECDKWFYTANQMDTHKRKVHNKSDQDDLPFICEICNKRYRSGSMLSTHKFKKHYKMAKFSCEKCGKKFVNEQQLHIHKQIHVNKK